MLDMLNSCTHRHESVAEVEVFARERSMDLETAVPATCWNHRSEHVNESLMTGPRYRVEGDVCGRGVCRTRQRARPSTTRSDTTKMKSRRTFVISILNSSESPKCLDPREHCFESEEGFGTDD